MRVGVIILCWIGTLTAAVLVGIKLAPSPENTAGVIQKTVIVTNTVERLVYHTGDKDGPEGSAAGATKSDGAADPASAGFLPASSADAAAVLRTRDPASRVQAFAKLLAGLTAGNARAMMEMFLKKGFKTPREEEEIRMLAEAWAAIDGKSAADFLASLPYNQRPRETIRATLTEWSMHDLEGAEAWARARTTNQPNPYMIGVIAGAANANLARAEQLLYEMPFSRERGDALNYVMGAHLDNGNADAMNWATSVPDPWLKQATIRRVASQVAVEDPASAANWVVQNSSEQSLSYNVSSVAKQWSYADAEAAVSWAFSLPPGQAQDAAVAATLPSLAAKNPAAVETMLLNQPPSKATDPARVRLVREYTVSDPPRAMAWASTVTDPRSRDHMTEHVMESWQKTDPAAAAQFVQPITQ